MPKNPEGLTAYPLCWPHGQARTPDFKVSKSNFSNRGVGGLANGDEMLRQIRLMGGQDIVISSNIPVRNDGQPYADASRRIIRDAGVAVYFIRKRQPVCFACDRWQTPAENIRAISLTIEALRGIERWGSAEMVDRAFTGYLALEGPMVTPAKKTWRQVLGYESGHCPPLEGVKQKYLQLSIVNHPDCGGDHDLMAQINQAWQEAQDELSK